MPFRWNKIHFSRGTGNETEWRYGFVGLGNLEFDETDAQSTIDDFNLRLIDETHPKFDPQIQKTGKMMGKMFSGFESILGNPYNEGEEEKDGPLMDDEQQSMMFDLFKELQNEYGSEDEFNRAKARDMFGNIKPKKSKKK